MAGEIVVAYHDGSPAQVDEVMVGGYKFVEDFTGGDRSVIVLQGLPEDSGTKLFKLDSADLPKERPASAIPTHLLDDKHKLEVLGPGGIYEQEITRPQNLAARLIIIHHMS